ncbi:unnamed protein product [Rotaria sordida]|uniref:Uncharacterized protein n=1 Tax=Rotaria sordida TaxID=392033 RepID=A0A815ML65_9BILA|nr:unnamed protein product [Rotaria sordida]
MNINQNYPPQFIPITLSKSLHLPPNSNRTAKASIPISSISSPFIPHQHFTLNSALYIPHKLLQFYNYFSTITLSNTTPYPQYVTKGICIGFLCSYTVHQRNIHTSIPTTKSYGVAKSFGEIPVSLDLVTNRSNTHYSHNSSKKFPINNQYCTDVTTNPITCYTIPSIHSEVDKAIRELATKIHHQQYHDDLLTLLFRFHRIFNTTTHNIADTPIHHVINTIPHTPPACKPYPQPDKEEPMYAIIQEFLQAGLIAESHSPYAAPGILVKKKDGSYRFVVDYKKLNLITIKDSSPLPNMEESIRKLGQGYKYFSKLDLKSGFYQIPINEGDREKTAFVTPFGLYQFNVLPMGLINSPPTFQKVMNDTLKPCRQFSLVYLDDIIVFSRSYEEHMIHLEQVFSALSSKHFVLNPPKCELMVPTINYLGHTISENRITPLTEKIQAILNIKEPNTLARANKFIGALSWYRKFIPNFATIAAPIHAVTNLNKNDRRKFKWTSQQSKAFHQLKQMLITAPLFLHFPVDNQPFILTTDASDFGIGGVLQQEVNGQLRNLYYHSQLMTPCERKYSPIEKEALAIYKCFARMRPYLLGRSIIVKTDHCPLCNIMKKTVRNARVDRISQLIQEYNIEKIIHINGRDNCLPDYLSRYPREQDDDLFDIDYGIGSKSAIVDSPSTNQTILNAMLLRPRKNKTESVKATADADAFVSTDPDTTLVTDTNVSHTKPIPHKFSSNYFDSNKLQQEQARDPNIQNIIRRLQHKPNNSPFIFKDNLLRKIMTISPHSKIERDVIYLPSSMIKSLLYACHNDPMTGGHFSLDRTYHKIKNLYWWSKMKLSIFQHIKSCLACQQYNVGRQKRHGQLNPIPPREGPFLLIGIDYCGPLKTTPRENQYVLVINDYFTRHIIAIALPNCTAETTAQALFNEYFCKYGIPSTILSDQGPHFQNQLMQNIRKLIGYNHIYSTPYHPQTNGVVERFNSTFIPQISKLQDTEDNNWDEYLQAVVFAYNSGVHKTTKYSPYELVYGRPPRLPISTRPPYFSFSKPNDYFNQLQKTLRIYHQAAKQNILRQQQDNKYRYDKNRPDPHYKLGDKVLTRIYGLRGKLDPKFSPIPKVIISVNHPIYIVHDTQTNMTSQVHVGDLRPIYTD